MNRVIEVRDIKHIKNMVFNLPEESGVYVLTGTNGSGKTTLMTCLLRIGQTRAFPDNFKVGSEKLDSFIGTITYKISVKGDERYVTYKHSGKRWPPTPKRNSTILNEFNFPEVRFLPATGNRLYVNDEQIESLTPNTVEKQFVDDMNHVFSTTKFNNLKYIQTGSVRGPGGGSQRWKRAYVLKTNNRSYFSEKNFSLGEILVLNTLLLIQDISNNSMLLIDELEMALHPKVQKKLLELLEVKAREKNLTIILSTHSSSIIKSAKKLIYLDNDGHGNITVKYNCYPATVLREVAIEEDVQPDYLFTVEDEMAVSLFREILTYYFSLPGSKLKPLYKIIPIGGYPNLLEFASHTNEYLFSNKIGQVIYFDADVEEIKDDLGKKGNNRSVDENAIWDRFKRHENQCFYLPITPELGLWDWLQVDTRNAQDKINDTYNLSIDLTDIINDINNVFKSTPETDNGTLRKKAKRRVKELVNVLSNKSNVDKNRIIQFLFQNFVQWHYSSKPNDKSKLKCDLGKIFSNRGTR